VVSRCRQTKIEFTVNALKVLVLLLKEGVMMARIERPEDMFGVWHDYRQHRQGVR
jgi:hypothetical protein